MANKIVLKKSSVAAKVPVAGDLDFGELAINYTDGKLYFKKADNTIDAFTTAAASAPVTSVGGNIGDITDAQLLASIKNVDGAGSGLDADTLDGNHASAFYLASNPNGYTSNTGTVTSVGATAPLVSSGGTAPSISIPAANSTTNGYMSSAYAAKLDGIAAGANNYTLPAATSTVLGGIELFSDTVQTVAANAVTATASRTYGVQVNSSGQAVVNVPWTDTNSGGTVTSVSGTGTVSGLTLTGTVTGSGSLTLGGTLSLTSGQVTTALGYTPYNSTNPNGYLTSSGTINYANYQAPTGNSNNWVQSFQQTPAHYTSFREMSANGPSGTWWFVQNLRHSNSSNYWGVQIAWGWEDNANNLYTRNITGNSFGGWVRYLNTSNYTSYTMARDSWNGNLYFNNDGRIYATIIYDTNNSGYYIDPNSTTYIYYLQSATTVRADSDRRLKDNIKPIENALEKVRKLQGCTYTRKDMVDKTKVYMGMIAQDVLPIVPEVVGGSEEGKYSLGYAEMVPLLNEAIKEQDLIILQQEARIAKLEALVNKLIG